MNKKIAIIPARSGSTRIKNKNTKSFSDSSLLKIAIENIKNTKIFDQIFLLTDSEKIAQSVQNLNVEVPYIRSIKTSDNHATLKDVIDEFVNKYKCFDKDIDFLCCIFCTSPFTKPNSIKKGFKLISRAESTTVISVGEYHHPIERSFELNAKDWITNVSIKNITQRTQDFNKRYFDAGQFYWINLNKYDFSSQLISEDSQAIIIPSIDIFDIDNDDEFEHAEHIYNLSKK